MLKKLNHTSSNNSKRDMAELLISNSTYVNATDIRYTSGKDKNGRIKPARLRLLWAVKGQLKNAVIGAATSAIGHGDNVFKDYYERMLSNGIIPTNDKHSVARKMVSTMSAMWKTGNIYNEKLL